MRAGYGHFHFFYPDVPVVVPDGNFHLFDLKNLVFRTRSDTMGYAEKK